MKEALCDGGTIPKLSFSSLQSKIAHSDPPFMSTPPVHAVASVPFEWEEAPGVPRMREGAELNDRLLELPPRLAAENVPSPTTVLDGPYAGLSRSFSIARSGWEKVGFGSTRWLRGLPKRADKTVAGDESSDESTDVKRTKSGLSFSKRRSRSRLLLQASCDLEV